MGEIETAQRVSSNSPYIYASSEDYQRLAEKIHELEEVRSHSPDSTTQFDLAKLRDRVLAELKLGKQAPGYKAAQKALENFIKLLEP